MLWLKLGTAINRVTSKLRDSIHFNLEQEDAFNLLLENGDSLLIEFD